MKLFISILVPLLVGAVAGLFTSSGVNGWYAVANKPWFNPPNWIFAPVWTLLYILMGIAFFLVWKASADKNVKQTAMILFSIQLILNFFWSFIFFKLQQPGWAFAEIILMWVMILLTILWFGKISAMAAWLLVPYICWVSFATVLNYSIWKLN
ncbi:MAG: tryptophan-rich sensory protein [Chitinophagaceae bacterium]|nr:tryptophan-rich sensory protein [Chitinophagaceae bacterium]MBK7123816.1 tryptophan-rich sensory protein [Chitinophagaceae bacterium]MBK9533509.1 tryptophan-rich sensory protein [Chitinophagaceae bacterium]